MFYLVPHHVSPRFLVIRIKKQLNLLNIQYSEIISTETRFVLGSQVLVFNRGTQIIYKFPYVSIIQSVKNLKKYIINIFKNVP